MTANELAPQTLELIVPDPFLPATWSLAVPGAGSPALFQEKTPV
ncbi:MAG: hypothetical protein AB7U95_20730 [Reyranella sp.]